MTKKISAIEGIGPSYQSKLSEAGIRSVEALLELGGQKKGRTEISEKSGITENLILDWVNMADLFRVKGIAGQFAELLKASGVDTVKELATRNSTNLRQMLLDKNNEKKLTKVVPSVEKINDFIGQAKRLGQKVFH